MGMRIGVDIGGTFTDFMLIDQEGQLSVFKTPSTPANPERAIYDGLEALARTRGVTVDALIGQTDLFIHGTTIATNTVIQRNGPKIGILHTEGFRDILFLRDGFKSDRYDLHQPPPDPFIPRYLRLGVVERIRFDGSLAQALDEQSVRDACATFRREGVTAVAVCLLWSMINPAHEARIREILRAELPDVYVALSSDVLPALREWPRSCATALSAYVGPVLGRYLSKVAAYLEDRGYRNQLLVMQSTGGSAAVSEIEKRPVLAIGSGPAAAPAAGQFYAGQRDEKNLMLIDMGGTSFEVSLITDGAIPMSRDIQIERMPIGVAAVDVHSIGAGGGSIAWIDSGGMLRVGPRSAGADPGPACYGRGGLEPTVTDANLVLGYLNPECFLGGQITLDPALSERAIRTIAGPLDLSLERAAAAVYDVVNANMVGAMRAVSVMRGIDPRGYSVLVGGGAGGAHAARIAEQLGMRRVICPVTAGALCAFGMLAADVRHTYLKTYPTNTATVDAGEVNAIFAELEQQALTELRAEGFDNADIILRRYVDAKYPYQGHETTVQVADGRLGTEDVAVIAENFHALHERLYTYCIRTMSVDINGWRVIALGRLPPIRLNEQKPAGGDAGRARKGVRQVYFAECDGWREAPVYDGESLAYGMSVPGPAIVELPTTTIVVCPDHRLSVNRFGDYDIDLPIAATAGKTPSVHPPATADQRTTQVLST